jgi:hypothetical protein
MMGSTLLHSGQIPLPSMLLLRSHTVGYDNRVVSLNRFVGHSFRQVDGEEDRVHLSP